MDLKIWAILMRFLAGAFLVGMVFWSFSKPEWEKQFKATGDALTQAQSFHVEIVTKEPGGDTHEVIQEANCPNEYHTLQRHIGKDGALIPMEDVEAWSVGGKHVLRQNEKVMDTHSRTGAAPCGTAYLLELGMVPNMKLVLLHGNGKRGSEKTVDGKTCREWTIQMPKGDGWGDLYTMCVDERNLPLEVIGHDAGYVAHASHFNETITLPAPPEVNVQPAYPPSGPNSNSYTPVN